MSYLPEELRHTHRNINAILKDDCVRGRSHQGGWSERGAMKEPFLGKASRDTSIL